VDQQIQKLIASKDKEPLKAKPLFIHQASSIGEAKNGI